MSQPQTSKPLGLIWGERIAARRVQMGLSQSQFAEVIGTTQQSISRIETGVAIPRDTMKVRIAQRTGTPIVDLFPWPEGHIKIDGAA